MSVIGWIVIGVLFAGLVGLALCVLALLGRARALRGAIGQARRHAVQAEVLRSQLEALQPRIDQTRRRVDAVRARRAAADR